MGINFDDRDFKNKVGKLLNLVDDRTKKANSDVASEILRLSQREVPHDKGTLQNSGHVEPSLPSLEVIVGYNTVYAARLHENPEYHFQAGRKGKYLEDPIKNNLSIFKNYYDKILNEGGQL